MGVLKKNSFDVCAGDCANCPRRGIKNLSLLTVVTKKKISTKYVPPDMGAVKLALDLCEGEHKDVKDMTDEEIFNYEAELMNLLKLEFIQKSTEDDDG